MVSVYFFSTLALISTLLSATPALAYDRGDLQLSKLLCAIREGHFITFFEFKMQVVVDHPVMTGEISNYVEKDGKRKYISGMLFTSIAHNNSVITGDTGDPSDIIGRFKLTRLDATYAGRWSYEFRRSESEIVRATFACTYSDKPPVERKLRWPHNLGRIFRSYDRPPLLPL